MSESVQLHEIAPGRYDYKAEFAEILKISDPADVDLWVRRGEEIESGQFVLPETHENPLIQTILRYWSAGYGLAGIWYANMFRGQSDIVPQLINAYCAPCVNQQHEVWTVCQRGYPTPIKEGYLIRKLPAPEPTFEFIGFNSSQRKPRI